jgi:F-type H+-transporting ATPase subunit gamma
MQKGKTVLANSEPYFNRIQRTMTNILNGVGQVQSPYFKSGKGGTAIVVVMSDKGLAGGYNSNVYHYVIDLCKKIDDPCLIVIGQVGQRYFEPTGLKTLKTFCFNGKLPDAADANTVSEFVFNQFAEKDFKEIRLVYTRMVNILKHKPEERLLLPFDRDEMRKLRYNDEEVPDAKNEHFEYLPSPEEVFNALAPQYVTGLIYGGLLEGYASEQAERMTAMDQSSRNAEDMLGSLQLFYNRARQANITQEITEISAGTAALA